MSHLTSPIPLTLTLQERFIVSPLEFGFAVYDRNRPQPRNLNGFFCVSTHDLEITAWTIANDLNDGEDSIRRM